MKLPLNQLHNQLGKQFAPIYFVSGDEPFQVDEACRLIRQAAKQRGYTERQVLHADRGFDWSSLAAESSNLSLFANKKLIELRIPNAKPGREGTKALQEYSEQLPQDTCLLISAGKLDSAQTRSKWFQSLDQVGVLIQVWPIEPVRLPQWIGQRLKQRNLHAATEALKLLADRVEGNLLAADQELEKLLLLYGEGELTTEQVQEAVSDSARFDIFSFADAALAGKPERVSRLLFGLKAEGVEPVLMLWVLQREIRLLGLISADIKAGTNMNAAMAGQRVWDKRKPLIGQALKRCTETGIQQWLKDCRKIDRIIKGQEAGRAWDELLELALQVAGKPTLHH